MNEANTPWVLDDESSIKSDNCSGSNRVKYLYSYGGKILPRSADGKLHYVGGETRVMAANRNISFADLIAKMAETLGSDVLLKCQLPGEDLDALVSIKSDEELHNMLEEYEMLPTKLRVFLFPKPANPCRAVALSGPSTPRIQFARKAAKESSYRKAAAFNCISKNPCQGGGLAHFLVQY
ncbi:hypothetical protein SUGI_0645710 [Cryptomeria japonica]|nr:hypothetical protein SUGI_0645710 [Cryptomeria japonica]